VRIKPLLEYARRTIPGQSKFMAWLESRDGSYFAEGVVFGRTKDLGSGPERIFQDAISRVGRGFQIRAAMVRADKVAHEKGLTQRFEAGDSVAVAEVIAGVLADPIQKKAPVTPSSGSPEIVHLEPGQQPDAGMQKAIIGLVEGTMGGPPVQYRLALMLLNENFRRDHGITFRYTSAPEAEAQAQFAKLQKPK
jgi:hypothetical protein